MARRILTAYVLDDKSLRVEFDPTCFEDYRIWGLALADFARHIARGLEMATGQRQDEMLADILQFMDKEILRPTDLGKTRPPQAD